MKTRNAQMENVKELLRNIIGVAVGYDGFSKEDSLKGLIDEMSDWACEALKILEELPQDSRGQETQFLQRALGIIEDMIDENECSFDQHGNCQEHGWTLSFLKCPQERAKQLLSEIKIYGAKK